MAMTSEFVTLLNTSWYLSAEWGMGRLLRELKIWGRLP